jgi:hypothetical protein
LTPFAFRSWVKPVATGLARGPDLFYEKKKAGGELGGVGVERGVGRAGGHEGDDPGGDENEASQMTPP